jgi:hypothetical protein
LSSKLLYYHPPYTRLLISPLHTSLLCISCPPVPQQSAQSTKNAQLDLATPRNAGLKLRVHQRVFQKFCKVPINDPDKIHGYAADHHSDDRYVKLGSVCGYFEYVEGIMVTRHLVEVCCVMGDVRSEICQNG